MVTCHYDFRDNYIEEDKGNPPIFTETEVHIVGYAIVPKERYFKLLAEIDALRVAINSTLTS